MLKALASTPREGNMRGHEGASGRGFRADGPGDRDRLRREGMAVDVAYDGDEALGHLALTRYDVVGLDRDLPGVHGDEICRRLAARRAPSPVLLRTPARHLPHPGRGPGMG